MAIHNLNRVAIALMLAIIAGLYGCGEVRLVDQRIPLKEGESLYFAVEGLKGLNVAVAVVEGKLSIAEIEPHGRSFMVSWSGPDHWVTATEQSEPGMIRIIQDIDMDGIADLCAIRTNGVLTRYRSGGQTWEFVSAVPSTNMPELDPAIQGGK